jgi:hypothetical protein
VLFLSVFNYLSHSQGLWFAFLVDHTLHTKSSQIHTIAQSVMPKSRSKAISAILELHCSATHSFQSNQSSLPAEKKKTTVIQKSSIEKYHGTLMHPLQQLMPT